MYCAGTEELKYSLAYLKVE